MCVYQRLKNNNNKKQVKKILIILPWLIFLTIFFNDFVMTFFGLFLLELYICNRQLKELTKLFPYTASFKWKEPECMCEILCMQCQPPFWWGRPLIIIKIPHGLPPPWFLSIRHTDEIYQRGHKARLWILFQNEISELFTITTTYTTTTKKSPWMIQKNNYTYYNIWIFWVLI